MQVPHWVIWRLRMANDWDWHRDFVLHMAVSRTIIANIRVWNTSVDFLIHILVSNLRLRMVLMRLRMLIIALFVHLWRHNEFILILGVFFFNHWISLPAGNRYFFTSKLIKSPRKTERLERTDQHFFQPSTTFPSAYNEGEDIFFHFFSNAICWFNNDGMLVARLKRTRGWKSRKSH